MHFENTLLDKSARWKKVHIEKKCTLKNCKLIQRALFWESACWKKCTLKIYIFDIAHWKNVHIESPQILIRIENALLDKSACWKIVHVEKLYSLKNCKLIQHALFWESACWKKVHVERLHFWDCTLKKSACWKTSSINARWKQTFRQKCMLKKSACWKKVHVEKL